MPTLTMSLPDLQKLLKKKVKEQELKELLEYAKAELDVVSTKDINVEFNDTNQPVLWSTEGLARLLRGVLGKEKGLATIKLEKQKYNVVIDRSVRAVRPAIATFVAKGPALSDEALLQLIQMQEKLADNYGRKRRKLSIGLYPSQKIVFPVTYKAVDPKSVSFVPLDYRREMNLGEILEEHPKGKEYGKIISGAQKYPILIDDAKQVLSLAPIINSATTGKLEAGDKEIFFDATGTDDNAVALVATIFAYALVDRGYKIYPCVVSQGKNTATHPIITPKKIKFNPEDVERLLGLTLTKTELTNLLKAMRYEYKPPYVLIPPYRQDILHQVDIIEDIAIAYGYNNIEDEPLKQYTVGKTFPITSFIDASRDIMMGIGYQEIMSPVLSNTTLLYDKMQLHDVGTVEIKNPMSATYAAVRTWLIPILLDVLSKNKHAEFPQRIFEQGIVTVRKGKKITDYERLAGVTTHTNASYTEARQHLEYLFRMQNIKWAVEEVDHPSFIPGRAARIVVNKVKVAYVGEIHPSVLEQFGIEQSVAAFELNLTDLFNATHKN